MRLKEFFDRFIFVYKCVGCGELLSYEQSKNAFCKKCRAAYDEAKTVNCPSCYRETVACTCMPKALSKSGALCLRKLMPYDKMKEHTPPNRLLYRLKHQPNSRLEHFVADELAPLMCEELAVLSVDLPSEQAVIVYLPRSRQAKRAEGFDQSERLSRALSRILKIPVAKAIVRTRRGRVQKDLGAVERMENAKESFRYNPHVDVKGKYVLLFDDVVTTGAGMSVCTALLRRAGAKGVLCFCMAIG